MTEAEVRAKRILCPECGSPPEVHGSLLSKEFVGACSLHSPKDAYNRIYDVLSWLEDTSDVVHNHTETGRRSPCPACYLRLPDVENEDAPPGCTYEFQDCGIEWVWSCRRHGFMPKNYSLTNESMKTYTGPCLAIIKE